MNHIFSFNKRLVHFCLNGLEATSSRHPILRLNIEHLYPNSFHLVKSSFQHLPIDIDNDQRLQKELGVLCVPPTRFRRYAEFQVQVEQDAICRLQSNYQPTYEFSQEVDDFRQQTRTFHTVEAHILNRTFIPEFISHIGSLVHALEAKKAGETARTWKQTNMKIALHQVRQVCYPSIEADNSPEGIHQDGADYIVSALVVNRQNVKDGQSIVYAPDKREVLLQHTLRHSELLFQEDRELWHTVTPIQCADPQFCGIRDILGLDIQLQ